jgi:hypothetical protein
MPVAKNVWQENVCDTTCSCLPKKHALQIFRKMERVADQLFAHVLAQVTATVLL